LVKNYQESLKPTRGGAELSGAKPATKAKSVSFEIADTQKNTFNTYFGTKVEVKMAGNGKGKITIPFHSEEDFNRIIKLIKN